MSITPVTVLTKESLAHHEGDMSPDHEVVRALYLGLLGRNPLPGEIARATLSGGPDAAAVVAEICRTTEFWARITTVHAGDFLRVLYSCLLGREPDPVGLGHYSNRLGNAAGLPTIITDIIGSEEFIKAFSLRRKWPNPAITYDHPCIIFLHIHKTAGTSIINHLKDIFGKKIYRDTEDSIHLYSPAYLSRYSVFAGHFNYDSIQYIPRKNKSIFTFVREPKNRLISYYYFLRAHEPSSPNYANWEMAHIANDLNIEPFFEDQRVRNTTGNAVTWNKMTRAIMGNRQWRQWRMALSNMSGAQSADYMENMIRPAILQRLKEFLFVGLQEDFGRSVELLFKTLGKTPPERKRSDNTLEKRIGSDPHLKKNLAKEPVTPRLHAALNGLVQLDNIVYGLAVKLYRDRFGTAIETAAPKP